MPPTDLELRQSSKGLQSLGILAVAYALYSGEAGRWDVLVGIFLSVGVLLIVLPLLAFWVVRVEPLQKKLVIRHWWKTTSIDLLKAPVSALLLLESNTERGLWFVRIVLSDGHYWTLPSEFTSEYTTLATALRSCSPGLVERKGDLLSEGV